MSGSSWYDGTTTEVVVRKSLTIARGGGRANDPVEPEQPDDRAGYGDGDVRKDRDEEVTEPVRESA